MPNEIDALKHYNPYLGVDGRPHGGVRLATLDTCGCRWICEGKLTACPHQRTTRQPSAPKANIIPWWRN